MTEHLYTDWCEHDGLGCPYIPGTEVEVKAQYHPGSVRGAIRLTLGSIIVPRDFERPSPWFNEDYGVEFYHNNTLVLIPRILRHRARRHPAASLLIARARASASFSCKGL